MIESIMILHDKPIGQIVPSTACTLFWLGLIFVMSIQYGHKDVLEQFDASEGTYKLKTILNPKGLSAVPPLGRIPAVRLSFCDSRSACCINSGRDIYIYPVGGCQVVLIFDLYILPL